MNAADDAALNYLGVAEGVDERGARHAFAGPFRRRGAELAAMASVRLSRHEGERSRRARYRWAGS